MKLFKNKLIRITFIYIPAIVGVIISVLIYYSPYKYNEQLNKKAVVNTVIINKSAEEVYKYLGNSDNAREWSSYVNHITTLNENNISDGKIGSIRRCYQYKNEEKGNIWDEEILDVIPSKKRKLSVFNMKNFSVTSNNLITEQHYEVIDTNSCKLSFVVFIKNDASLLEKVSLALFGYKVSNVFQKNISNVKAICEKNENYERKYL
jgi:uncharacterized membrane protein